MHHEMNMIIHNHLLVQMVQDHQHLSSQNIYIATYLFIGIRYGYTTRIYYEDVS